jgi:hypothetical protein
MPADIARGIGQAVAEFEGRLPAQVQAQVRRLFEHGRAESMALAAQAALTTDGVISVADMVATSELTVRKAEEIVNALTTEGILKPAHHGDDERRFTFVEDGLPTLIWMTWAQRNLQPDARQPRAATAS